MAGAVLNRVDVRKPSTLQRTDPNFYYAQTSKYYSKFSAASEAGRIDGMKRVNFTASFPLSWPDWLERTGEVVRGRRRSRGAAGHAEVAGALYELGAVTGLTATDVRLCSNRVLSRSQPVDGGAAAWFVWDSGVRCAAYDRYLTPEDNFVAIAQLISACAAEFRRGGPAGVRQALSSFTPAARQIFTPSNGWRAVLGVEIGASQKEITAAFRRRAFATHPDQGGDRRSWDTLITAYRESQSSVGPPDITSEAFDWMSSDPDAQKRVWDEVLNGPDSENGDRKAPPFKKEM